MAIKVTQQSSVAAPPSDSSLWTQVQGGGRRLRHRVESMNFPRSLSGESRVFVDSTLRSGWRGGAVIHR